MSFNKSLVQLMFLKMSNSPSKLLSRENKIQIQEIEQIVKGRLIDQIGQGRVMGQIIDQIISYWPLTIC